jgi:hypothetical protein
MDTRQALFPNKVAVPLLASLALTSALLFAADPEPATPAPTAAPAPPRRLAPTPDRPLVLFNFRILQASPGKLEALHARLRDHEIPLLEQHGIFTLAVFVPAGENPGQLVYFITGAEGLTATTEGWAGFRKDPNWLHVLAETDKAGPLVVQERHKPLAMTSFSPKFPPDEPIQAGVFELRTYLCPDRQKHAALMRRFRDHTKKLFEKHGMTNVVYWTEPEEPEMREGLIYLLAHDSEEAAKESFAAFRSDLEWQAVKKASEEMSGGSLTKPENGVQSQFLNATDYSPLK